MPDLQPEISTLTIHGGHHSRSEGSAVSSIPNLSTSFLTHPSSIGFSANDLSEEAPSFYTRWGNPTLGELESRLAVLEGGEAAVTFGSGMAAIASLFLSRLSVGDHLIYPDVCYAGVAELAKDILPKYGILTSTADFSNLESVAKVIRPETKLIHIETPANPTLKLTDIAEVAKITKSIGAELSVDSTIATPLATRPLHLGADYVIHSLTKYMSGHGDSLGGAVIGSSPAMAELRRGNLIHLGGGMAPFNAWLTLRGLETLSPRMTLHQSNAQAVEEYLSQHPKISAVYWPGSSSHPQHELAARQMSNYSGLMSFSVKDMGVELAAKLAEKLKIISYAVSLGKTKSLIFYIPSEDILRSSFRLSEEQSNAYRSWAGEGLFRLSVGLESAQDLIQDLDQVLSD